MRESKTVNPLTHNSKLNRALILMLIVSLSLIAVPPTSGQASSDSPTATESEHIVSQGTTPTTQTPTTEQTATTQTTAPTSGPTLKPEYSAGLPDVIVEYDYIDPSNHIGHKVDLSEYFDGIPENAVVKVTADRDLQICLERDCGDGSSSQANNGFEGTNLVDNGGDLPAGVTTFWVKRHPSYSSKTPSDQIDSAKQDPIAVFSSAKTVKVFIDGLEQNCSGSNSDCELFEVRLYPIGFDHMEIHPKNIETNQWEVEFDLPRILDRPSDGTQLPEYSVGRNWTFGPEMLDLANSETTLPASITNLRAYHALVPEADVATTEDIPSVTGVESVSILPSDRADEDPLGSFRLLDSSKAAVTITKDIPDGQAMGVQLQFQLARNGETYDINTDPVFVNPTRQIDADDTEGVVDMDDARDNSLVFRWEEPANDPIDTADPLVSGTDSGYWVRIGTAGVDGQSDVAWNAWLPLCTSNISTEDVGGTQHKKIEVEQPFPFATNRWGTRACGYNTITDQEIQKGHPYVAQLRVRTGDEKLPYNYYVTADSVTIPPVVPFAPGEFVANPFDGGAEFSWQPINDGGSPLSYLQYRTKLGAETEWGEWTRLEIAPYLQRVILTGFTNGTSYNLQVRGVNCITSEPGDGNFDGTTETDEVICTGYGAEGGIGFTPNVIDAEIPETPLRLHSCRVNAGKAECWGNNDNGQLGDGTTTTRYSPVTVKKMDGTDLDMVTAVEAGWNHTCAIASDTVYCWGANSHGQLGIGNTTASLYAQIVEGGLNGVTVDQIGLGVAHTCARVTTAIHCWGDNSENQGGAGYSNRDLPPTDADALKHPATSTIADMTVGGWHTCFRDSGMGMICVGDNSNGQLGDNTTTDHDGSMYEDYRILATETITGFSAGLNHTCALTATSTYCWGQNLHGQVGNGSYEMAAAPVLVQQVNTAGDALENLGAVTAISAGDLHTCAIVSARVECWGNNSYGQLGVSDLAVPVTTPEEGFEYLSASSSQDPVTPDTDTITSVVASSFHTCAIGTDTDGSAIRPCWGLGSHGQLGIGYVSKYHGDRTFVGEISGTVEEIDGGQNHTCIISGTDSALGCWGGDQFGQIGGAVAGASLTPYSVQHMDATSAGVSDLAVGAEASHSCTLHTETPAPAEGTATAVRCWGRNNMYQVGKSPVSERESSNKIVDTMTQETRRNVDNISTILIELEPSEIDAIAAGDLHSCYLADSPVDDILTRVSVDCWGSNSNHQTVPITDLNNESPISSPTKGITINTGLIADIAAGTAATCAILDTPGEMLGDNDAPVARGDGVSDNVMCWGHRLFNRDFDTTSASVEIEVVDWSLYTDDCRTYSQECISASTGNNVPVVGEPISGVTQVVVGGNHACALTNGNVACWGNADYGQLGYAHAQTFSPDKAMYVLNGHADEDTRLANVSSIAAGKDHTCALIDNDGQPDDGTVYCWGRNDYRQLGDHRFTPLHLGKARQVRWVESAIEIGAGAHHTCVIMEPVAQSTDNRVACWGLNEFGQTGSDSVIHSIDTQAGPEAQFEFAVDDIEAPAEDREIGVYFPILISNHAGPVTYRFVDSNDMEYTLPAGLTFDQDWLALHGTPANSVVLDAVTLKYQAIDDSSTPVVLASEEFTLTIEASLAPAIATPISDGYPSGRQAYLLNTANPTETIDLANNRYTHPTQTGGLCSATVTTDCMTLSVDSSDDNIVAAAIEGTTLTLTAGTDGGEATITVTITDQAGLSTEDVFSAQNNEPPSLVATYRDELPAQIVLTAGSTFNFDIASVFTDRENDILTLTEDSLQDLTVQLSARQPSSVTSSVAGTYALELCASDLFAGTGEEVCVPDRTTKVVVVEPIAFESITQQGSTSLNFYLDSLGVIAAPIASGGFGRFTYEMTADTDFEFDPAQGTITLSSTATESTLKNLTITATDSRTIHDGQNAADNSAMTTIPVTINAVPSAIPTAAFETIMDPLEFPHNEPIDSAGVVFDEASNVATAEYCFTVNPACPGGTLTDDDVNGITFSHSNRRLTGTPDTQGLFYAHLVVTDGTAANRVDLPFSYRVAANRPPEISFDVPGAPDLFFGDNGSLEIDFLDETIGIVTDPDAGDTITIDSVLRHSSDTSENVSIDVSSLPMLTLTPGSAGPGSDLLVVTASDADGAMATANFTVYYSNPPVTAATPWTTQEIKTGDGTQRVNVDISGLFSDPDTGDILTYRIDAVSTTDLTVALGTAVGTIDITRSDMTASGTARICAADISGQEACGDLTINISPNQPPVESASGPVEVTVTVNGTSVLQIANQFTDPDDTNLTCSVNDTNLDTATATAQFDQTACTVTFTGVVAGNTTYSITVTDPEGASADREVTVQVNNPPSTGGGGNPFPGGGVGGPGTPPTTGTPQPMPADGDNRFSDDDGNTHEANINMLAEMGISRGCNPPENTEFCPSRAVTRGEMATFMVRAFTLGDTSDDLFGDDDGTTHESNINRLATAEITRGCNPPENTRYCPNRAVTRAQMATFLARALDLPDGSGDFTDTSSSVHASDINRIASVGITRGCNPPTNSRYCPDRAVTRAEMATFLIRATSLNT